MYTQSVLLIATAALAHAELYPAHQNIKRAIEARQTGSIVSCIQPLLSIYSTLPTPPPQLENLPAPADPCHVTVPPSIAPAYSSYSSEIVSWVDANSAEIFSALSACPAITDIAGPQISSITAGFCSDLVTSSEDHSGHSMTESVSSAEETGSSAAVSSAAPSASAPVVGGGSGAANGTFTSGGSGPTASGPAQTSSKSTALAARETGLVGAVIAAAGFLGAVAVL